MRKVLFLLLVIGSLLKIKAQTYTSLPYSTGFETGTLGSEWTTMVEGLGANLARVQVTTDNGPAFGTHHLTLDKNSTNVNFRTAEAWLHLDLSGETEVDLSFYFKDFDDENDVGINGDGIFFSDDAGATFIEVYHINPLLLTDNVWQRIELDVDVLADLNGLSLTDSFVIKFQQRDNNSIDTSAFTSTLTTDGHAYDSILVEVARPLTSGTISGNDTLCNGATTLNINNVTLPTKGDNTYTYTWEVSTNFTTWSSIIAPSNPSLIYNNPPTGIFWVRRGVSSISTGEGPIYTSPTLILNAVPTFVTFYGLDPNYCSNDTSVQLFGFPPGGGFSGGLGLSGNTFDPSTAPTSNAGTNSNITYTYTNSFGCTYDSTISTTVFNSPTVSISDLGAYLVTQSTPVIMNGLGLPAGGTHSYVGPGVAGNRFTPSASGGVGIKDITYTYTAPNGCSTNATIDADVTSTGVGSITGLAANYCETDNTNYPISASAPFGWTPASISGPGVTPTSTTTAFFNPSVAGDGNHTITFSFTILLSGITYTNTFSQSVRVNETPVISFQAPKFNYCLDDSVVSLQGRYFNGVWNDVSGNFSGPGISGNTFDPSLAGVGVHAITFEYTDGNLCTNTRTRSIRVRSLPTVSFSGLSSPYCKDESAVTLIGSPAGGTFSAPSGISGNQFLPALATTGTQNITYSYTNGAGCSNTISQSVTVNDLPVLSISGFTQPLYCEDNSPINISGNRIPFGSFSGASGGLTDFGNGTAQFNPSSLTPDSIYTISYTFTDGNGCTNTEDRNITVTSLPVVNFSGLLDSSEYCISEPLISLSGNHTSGVFSGTGVVNGVIGATFDPSISLGNNTITFTYTDPNLCTNSASKVVTIHPLPSVSFTGLTNTVCADEPEMTLIGNQDGGEFIGIDIFPLPFDTVAFIANNYDKVSESVSNFIIYNYTDSNMCFNSDTQAYTINPLPVIQFGGLDVRYCEDEDTTILFGSLLEPHPFSVSNSYFFGSGVRNSSYDPTIVAISDTVTSVKDTVYYVYVDNQGCRDTVFTPTVVHALPDVAFSFPLGSNFIGDVINDSAFCETETSIFLETDSLSLFGTGMRSRFLLKGLPISGGNIFNPSIVDSLGMDTLVYEYQDIYGCTNFDTHQFTIYPVPEPDFELSGFCNDDSISFYDSSKIQAFSIGNGFNSDVIVDWRWQFGDGNGDTVQVTKHKYTIPTSYSISLLTTTREGCSNSKSVIQLIGEPPVADFEWDNVCFGSQIQFSDLSTFKLVDPISKWNWVFDDGNELTNFPLRNGIDPVDASDNNGGITGGTYQNSNHIYQTQETFNVSLILETGSACIDTITKEIHIRPVIQVSSQDPYEEPFDSIDVGWFPTGTIAGVPSYSWEWGIAAGNIIDDQTSGNTSWVTGLNTDHQNLEQSYLDGPCFSFDSIKRPMIKMNYWSDMKQGNDGAVLQWSEDNGTTWNTIGDIADGINWYNVNSISGNPGEQIIKQVGWSYEDTTRGWTEARHDLDNLIGKKLVRLRIAFGSDANGTNEGIAFDNVWIGERSRVAILEYFTNTSESGSIQDDQYVDDLVERNKTDLVDIQYHTEFPGVDPMNDHNPSDPSARALYYGAFNVGRATLDGNAYNGVSSNIDDNDIKVQMLKDSPYSVSVRKDFINSNTEIKATVFIQAREDVDSSDISIRLVIVEKEINGIVGVNGDNQFKSVAKKMLPSASGIVLNKDWQLGEEKGFSETWRMQNVFDLNDLEIVAFIQDNITKEIYQVSTTDTNSVTSVIIPDPLRIEGKIEQNLKFKMFPNPTKGDLMILFNQVVNSPTIQIYNQMGELLKTYISQNRQKQISFNLDYPTGIYYVRTIANGEMKMQKLIITE